MVADPVTPDKQPAAHETAAVLRLHRAGWPPAHICKTLGMTQGSLVHELSLAIDAENEAHRLGLPIYDGQSSKASE